MRSSSTISSSSTVISVRRSIAVLLLDLHQLFADDVQHFLLVGENRLYSAIFCSISSYSLSIFSRSSPVKPLQAHVENRLGLIFRQLEPVHQAVPGFLRRARSADEGDHFVQVVQRDAQPFQNVGARFRLLSDRTRCGGG